MIDKITYWNVYHRVLDLLDEISKDHKHIRYKNTVKIYMGAYMYNVTMNSMYIINAVDEYFGKYDKRKIEFIRDEKLKLDEYAFTKKSEIIDKIKDLYEN